MKVAILFLLASRLFAQAPIFDEPHTLSSGDSICTEIACNLKRIQRNTVRDSAYSSNWSGYVGASNLTHPSTGSVTAVAGTWTIPTLHATTTTAYSAAWVGIDGFSDGTVEQIGTEQEWINGRQSNYAWFEMFPAGAYQIVGFPVNPGDSILASVTYVGSNTFTLLIQNLTRRVSFTVPSSYTRTASAQRSSAEWIMEAPSSNTGILPLANFGTTTFINCVATINGVRAPISNTHWQSESIEMITGRTIKAIPSSLYGGGQNFMMTWEHQ